MKGLTRACKISKNWSLSSFLSYSNSVCSCCSRIFSFGFFFQPCPAPQFFQRCYSWSRFPPLVFPPKKCTHPPSFCCVLRTTLQQNVVEQQEERQRSKEKEEELLALESSQDPPEVEVGCLDFFCIGFF